MKNGLFSFNQIRWLAVVGALAGAASLPVASASADTSSTTLLVTAQGTSALGQELPVLGTQGWYVTLPVGSDALPGESIIWDASDFTITSELTVGDQEIVNLYLDPRMAK
jgi:hypothetical protein